jgi:hypothetical protein
MRFICALHFTYVLEREIKVGLRNRSLFFIFVANISEVNPHSKRIDY